MVMSRRVWMSGQLDTMPKEIALGEHPHVILLPPLPLHGAFLRAGIGKSASQPVCFKFDAKTFRFREKKRGQFDRPHSTCQAL